LLVVLLAPLPCRNSKNGPKNGCSLNGAKQQSAGLPWQTKLSNWESFSLLEEGKIARALSRIAGKFSAACLKDVAFESDLSGIEDALAFYRDNQFEKHPADFFRQPQGIPKVIVSDPCALTCGEVVDLAFETSFEPTYGPFAQEFSQCCENKIAYARMWRHPQGESLGTLVAIHGWMMGDSRLSAVTLVPGYFYRLGLDVILYELPYHGRRVPACQQEASLFPSFNVARTNEGFAQAISELRSLTLWLKSQNDNPVGVIGLSLGGYTAALWASLEKLAFAILVAPLVSMAEVAQALLATQDDKLRHAANGVLDRLTLEQLREGYAVHCPLSYQPKVELERLMIIAGLADDLVPLAQPEQLWQHWNKPIIQWLRGGHLGQVVEQSTLGHVHEFLQTLGLAHAKALEVHVSH
jgi:hypothetical protein